MSQDEQQAGTPPKSKTLPFGRVFEELLDLYHDG